MDRINFGNLNPLEEKILINLEDHRIKPSSEDFEVVGVFNPGAAILDDGSFIIMARVAERPREESYGKYCYPRAVTDGNEDKDYRLEIIPVQEDDLAAKPDNVTLRFPNGIYRNRHISHLRKIISRDGVNIASMEEKPTFYPVHPYEEFGIEDPRCTALKGSYYMSYVACSEREGVVTGLIKTSDFVNFERYLKPKGDTPHPLYHGKDLALFPDFANCPYPKDHPQCFAALIRPATIGGLNKPGIRVAWSDDVIKWDAGRLVVESKGSEYLGTGAPVIKLDEEGIWLGVHHEVYFNTSVEEGREYVRAFFGLDLKEPWAVRYRSKPVKLKLKETMDDFVPGLVYHDYVTGAIRKDDKLYTYGGVGDRRIAVVNYKLEDVLRYLKDTNIL